jgi:hypothetical protein
MISMECCAHCEREANSVTERPEISLTYLLQNSV